MHTHAEREREREGGIAELKAICKTSEKISRKFVKEKSARLV